MKPFRYQAFIVGMLAGLLLAVLLPALTVRFLPRLLVVKQEPVPADAVVILGGDVDGSRLRKGVRLFDDKLAPRLILTGGGNKWEYVLKKLTPEVRMEGRGAVFLESTDTRTDALITLQYVRDNHLRNILVVTSPYHTRRAQLVFNDIFDGSGIVPRIVSTGSYGRLVPPEGRWWSDRGTVETVWLEFGKIFFWELTPFMEFQGEGRKLKESERGN